MTAWVRDIFSVEEALEEDLVHVESVQQELQSMVSDTNNVDGHTEYTIRTTDRDGNSWEATTRYSGVVALLEDLKKRRGLELPSMPAKHYLHSLDRSVVQERRGALDKVLRD